MKKILESKFILVITVVLLTLTVDVIADTVITSGSVSYTNNKTTETTVNGALDELFSAVDINERLGNTDNISSIGDGTVSGAISTNNSTINTLYNNRSHVGMVIHSTTLDTMAKVKAIYGGTTWVKIEGRFLLGSSSSYAVNSTGGAETVTLNTNNLPSHYHSVGAHSHGLNSHTHSIPKLSGSTNETGAHTHNTYILGWTATGLVQNNNSYLWALGSNSAYHALGDFTGASSGSHKHDVSTTANTTGEPSTTSTAKSTEFNTGNTGSGTAHNNMPPYKTVYIWERTA